MTTLVEPSDGMMHHQIEFKGDLLINAINEQNLHKCKDYLQEECDIDYREERGGFTALMRACLLGNKAIVKLLLKKNPTIDIQNNLKKTALMVSRSAHHSSHFIPSSSPHVLFFSSMY